MNKTGIEYLDYTWNPIGMRCTPVSEGCKNCWHLAMAKRHAANPRLSESLREARAGGSPIYRPDEIHAPEHLKKPARIGVMFMGDLFHGDLTFNQITTTLDVIHRCPQHTFLILTKRVKEMQRFTERIQTVQAYSTLWPQKNIWLGVSIENQPTADERIRLLVDITEKLKMNTGWVSVEPMLEEIQFPYFRGHHGDGGIRWVVCGAESGPGARTCNFSWVLRLRNQCVNAGVPFFYKQGPNEFCFQNLPMPFLEGKQWAQMPEVKI